MTENKTTTTPKKRVVSKTAKTSKSTITLTDFRSWLATLVPGITPTIHINGKDYPACILSVDFGTPLEPFELTVEQATELPKRMKAVIKEVLNNDALPDNDIRIWNDTNNGVWWSGTRHWN